MSLKGDMGSDEKRFLEFPTGNYSHCSSCTSFETTCRQSCDVLLPATTVMSIEVAIREIRDMLTDMKHASEQHSTQLQDQYAELKHMTYMNESKIEVLQTCVKDIDNQLAELRDIIAKHDKATKENGKYLKMVLSLQQKYSEMEKESLDLNFRLQQQEIDKSNMRHQLSTKEANVALVRQDIHELQESLGKMARYFERENCKQYQILNTVLGELKQVQDCIRVENNLQQIAEQYMDLAKDYRSTKLHNEMLREKNGELQRFMLDRQNNRQVNTGSPTMTLPSKSLANELITGNVFETFSAERSRNEELLEYCGNMLTKIMQFHPELLDITEK